MARWELSVVLILFAASAHLSSGAFVSTSHFQCPTTSNYTPGSAYQQNLNALFLNLSSDATSASGFAAATSGESPYQVQGLVLCRGDLSATDCATCISRATSESIQSCPKGKSFIVWLDECLLKYSDQSFIGTVDTIFTMIGLYNPNNISDPARFRSLLGALMDNLSSEATANPSARLFATGEVRFTDFQKIYGLVQCTRDITVRDCKTCLVDLIAFLPKCCSWKIGARILTGSCYIRFEPAPFFNSTAVGKPPPPLPTATVKRGETFNL